jgi:hypothetical protein
VEAVRGGASQREVAERLGVGRGSVQRAVLRAGDDDLEHVDWADRPTTPHRTRRTDPSVEARIARVRGELRGGILGDHGPAAIREALLAAGDDRVPSVRTIARIVTP